MSEPWVVKQIAIPDDGRLMSIAFADNRFVAVGTHGAVFVSPDGMDWKRIRTGIEEDLVDVFYHRENVYSDSNYQAFMAVGKSNSIYASSDGESWKRIAPPQKRMFSRKLQPVRDWHGALSDTGILLYSKGDDTIPESWHRVWSGSQNRLQDASSGSGMFVMVGKSGAVAALPDSEIVNGSYRFTLGHSSTRADLNGIAWGQGLFIAVGDSGTALASFEGTVWKKDFLDFSGSIRDIAFGSGKFIAVADDRILIKDAGSPSLPDSSEPLSDMVVGIWTSSEDRAIQVGRLWDAGDTCLISDPITPAVKNWIPRIPNLPAWGNDTNDFVPPGWGFSEKVSGDLNQDHVDDIAFVLEMWDDSLRDSTSQYDAPYYYSPRILGIIFRDTIGNDYILAKQSNTSIEIHDDPYMEEPFTGFEIVDGALSIHFHFWTSMGTWSTSESDFKFRYLDGDFRLVSAKIEGRKRNTSDTWMYSYDFIAGRKISETGNDSDEGKVIPTHTEDTLKIKEPIDFGNFSERWEEGFE